MRALREQQGISLRKFAAKVGISATYLSKIEREDFRPPAEDKVIAIADALNQHRDEFLALAGRISSDVFNSIRRRPREMTMLVRAADRFREKDLQRLLDKLKSAMNQDNVSTARRRDMDRPVTEEKCPPGVD